MTQDRRHLIDDLVGDLRPVEKPGRVGPSLAVWLILATAYSVLIVAATGPWRPGAFGALVRYPAFAGETALAIVAILAVALAAVRSAIPGEPRRALGFRWALPPLLAWGAIYVVGFWYPAHPVSTLGGRGTCHWEIVLFSLPTLGLLLWLTRRLFPLWPRSGDPRGAHAVRLHVRAGPHPHASPCTDRRDRRARRVDRPPSTAGPEHGTATARRIDPLSLWRRRR
jgi:hypothetical protein